MNDLNNTYTRTVIVAIFIVTVVSLPTIYSRINEYHERKKCLTENQLEIINRTEWDIYFNKINKLYSDSDHKVNRPKLVNIRQNFGYATNVVWIEPPYYGGTSRMVVEIIKLDAPIARLTITNVSGINWKSIFRISDPESRFSCNSIRRQISTKVLLAFQP